MSLSGLQISLISHPATVYLSASGFIALFALNATLSFLPTITLLATLRIFVNVVLGRANSQYKLILAIVVLALAATMANVVLSASALAHTHADTAALALFAYQFIISSFVVLTMVIDAEIRKRKLDAWTRILLFPTLWSTQLFIISSCSPLGRIAIWSPVSDVQSYLWLLSYLGTFGIDWIVAAWATVVSDALGLCVYGSLKEGDIDQEQEPQLIDYELPQAQIVRNTTQGHSTSVFILAVSLIALTIPSHLRRSLPFPLESEHTIPLSVACALPYPSENAPPSFEHFLHETQTLLSHAKIVLWPEGAVRFETEDAKREAIKTLTQNAQASVIGMSFEDVVPLNDSDSRRSGLTRNGLMLIDKTGVVFEYYKRHLVPFVESYSMVASRNKPAIYEYPLIVKRNAHRKASDTLPVPISASICLDYAFNSPFSNLKQRPALILGPARTWHENIGAAMWSQAKLRAEEIGSALLWCDGGENGVSGAMGLSLGVGEVVQVGSGSWATTFALEIPLQDRRTAYGASGEWLSMSLLWALLGFKLSIDKMMMRKREAGEYSIPYQNWIDSGTRIWAFISRLRGKGGEQLQVRVPHGEELEHGPLI